jgi:lipopolysaccharide biosynthesis glycosyltransferase
LGCGRSSLWFYPAKQKEGDKIMWKFDHVKNAENIKEMLYFFDIINNLPTPAKRARSEGVGIPVILSSDDNYSCFVATTGASILYNTKSFIEFYIIGEGITEKNKKMIEKTFSAITSDFSIKFLECDSEKEFTIIKLTENYHVTLNTCNRLLFPKLAPKIDRAIYLDVDLIVKGDIKEIWDEKLDGHIIAAVPLFIDRLRVMDQMREKAGIPEDITYKYFNSGVMLIDYKEWRKQKGSNQKIVDDLFDVLGGINADVTPDELILNKFCHLNGGYKILPHKYNVNPYYSYQYLLKNKNKLNDYEKDTLIEFEKAIKKYRYEEAAKLDDEPVVRHFFGHEKPWNTVKQGYFPLPISANFADFWFYAKMTLYFEQIKNVFLAAKMDCPFYNYDERKIAKYRRKALMYKLLQTITLGTIKKFVEKKNHYRNLVAWGEQ